MFGSKHQLTINQILYTIKLIQECYDANTDIVNDSASTLRVSMLCDANTDSEVFTFTYQSFSPGLASWKEATGCG